MNLDFARKFRRSRLKLFAQFSFTTFDFQKVCICLGANKTVEKGWRWSIMKEVKVDPRTPPVCRLSIGYVRPWQRTSTPHIFAGWGNFLFITWTFPSTLYFSELIINMQKNTFFWIFRMELFLFSIRFDLEGGRLGQEPAKPDVATIRPTRPIHFFSSLLPNAYILRRIFPPRAKYVSFLFWTTTYLLIFCVTLDI